MAGRYKAKKTIVDGITFDSATEARRYKVLKERETRGTIANLTLQRSYKLEANGKLICRYVSDFEYDENGQHVVEDIKTAYTAKDRIFRLKYKMMKALLGIDVVIVFDVNK